MIRIDKFLSPARRVSDQLVEMEVKLSYVQNEMLFTGCIAGMPNLQKLTLARGMYDTKQLYGEYLRKVNQP